MDRHPQVMGESLEHYFNRVRGRKGDYHTFGSALGDIGNLAVELMGAKRGYNKRKTLKKPKKTGSPKVPLARGITINIQTGRRGASTAGRRLQQIQPTGLTFPNRSNALLQRTGFGFQGYGLDPQSQHNLAQVLSKSQEVNKKLDEQISIKKEPSPVEEAIKREYILGEGEAEEAGRMYGEQLGVKNPVKLFKQVAKAGFTPEGYMNWYRENVEEPVKIKQEPVPKMVEIKQEPIAKGTFGESVAARYNPLEMGMEKKTKKRNVEYLGRYYTPTEMRYIEEAGQYMGGRGTIEEPYIEV